MTPCVKRTIPLTRKIEPGKGSIFDFLVDIVIAH